MIADSIQKKEPLEPELESYFEVLFIDGSRVSEREVAWSSFSECVEVSMLGQKKMAYLSLFPVKQICVFHGGMEAIVNVPEGGKAYQCMRSEMVTMPGVYQNNRIIGRVVGYVLDGVVREEQYIDALNGCVQGVRT